MNASAEANPALLDRIRGDQGMVANDQNHARADGIRERLTQRGCQPLPTPTRR